MLKLYMILRVVFHYTKRFSLPLPLPSFVKCNNTMENNDHDKEFYLFKSIPDAWEYVLEHEGESFFFFGQFEEQQAFEKSRKFLRQLEICFAENPAHHQKIIKVLQSCADCLPQEIAEVSRELFLPVPVLLETTGVGPAHSPFWGYS